MFISEIQKSFEQSLNQWPGESTICKHSELGPKQETLITNYLLLRGQPDQLVVSISGTHGAEAYIGSIIQNKIIERLNKDSNFKKLPTILFIHNLNSFGSAWVRRGNHLNIDLNRNAWTDSPPENFEFHKFIPLLSSRNDFKFYSSFISLVPFLLKNGLSASSSIVASGQHQTADTLFFTGTEKSQELRFLENYLKTNLKPKKIFVLDIHTGLGNFASESLILEPTTHPAKAKQFESFFKTKLINENTPGFYKANGLLGHLFQQVYPKSELYYFTQEFGTRNFIKVLKALAQENASWNIKKNMDKQRINPMLDCFFPADESWRKTVTQTGIERFFELIRLTQDLSLEL